MKITTILKHYPHLVLILLVACVSQPADEPPKKIQTGSEQMNQYLPLLDGKNVAVVVNHTSMVGSSHLVDSLRKRGIKIQKVFGPEHGFRGQASDGEAVENEISDDFDIISLYGNNYKPTAEDLEAVDIVVFDIQDVGTRFYTYTSTMHYVMEACAENDVPVIILDRPNPNGHYIDGPILDPDFQSFVGMHPIPVVHGLTVGELAKMINSEGWLANQIQCDLTVIPVSNYTHSDQWSLSIPPSPNLPTDIAIGWYPSLCFFEGTKMSVGRGTPFPFQVIGYPDSTLGSFTFTPVSIPTKSKYPRFENQMCYGVDLRNQKPPSRVDLAYVIDFYQKFPVKDDYFISYFNKLAGTDKLMEQIVSGTSAEEIYDSWQSGLDSYQVLRKKYLLYPDFE